jgi:hypothetical protein
MDQVYDAVDQVHRCGSWGRGAPGQDIGLWIIGQYFMKRRGTRRSILQRPFTNERLGGGSGARWH